MSKLNAPPQVLLLTATITPPTDVRDLGRTDPSVRRRDYKQSLDFYLRLLDRTIDRIIFVDNSDSNLDDLRKIAERAGRADRVEFLSFYGLDYPPYYGRLYGELKLIERAMRDSAILSGGPQDQVVWKSTGRYLIRNLDAIVRKQPPGFDLYLNHRTRPIRWIDTYLMAWRRRGFDEFLDGLADRYVRHCVKRSKLPESGMTLEADLWDDVEEARGRIDIVPRYTEVPLVDAARGLDGKAYTKMHEYYLRVAALRLVPWLWI